MNDADSNSASTADERHLWMPPSRLREYQRNKIIGGALFLIIFVIWLVVQWSHPGMRWITIGLICVTAWVTFVSVIIDRERAKGRQVFVDANALHIVNPEGETPVRFKEVAWAEWHNPPADDEGLVFYDQDQRKIARIDTLTLTGESEARTFLGWVNRQVTITFDVRWPGYQDGANAGEVESS